MSELEQKGKSPEAASTEAPASETKSPRKNSPDVMATPPTTVLPEIDPILPPEHWATLDNGNSDDDSALGDSYSDSTASITSSILNYRTLYGRTFHSDIGNAQYCVDTICSPWFSMESCFWLLSRILRDFADKFPNCEVIGTDISPIQSTWVPPNLKFEIEDCTQAWTFPPNSFDFIHIRYLVGSIPDWTAFFKEAYSALEPGGYLESYETSARLYSDDDTIPPTSAMAQWTPLFIDGGRKIGRSFDVVETNTQNTAMKEAGFVDIQEKWIKKEIGTVAGWAVESDMEGFVMFVSSVQGWTKEEVQVYAAHLRRELRSKKQHVWYWQKIVWGRKPEAS
ncbi:related to methyltransferase [Cephalotrichum gorgonifer]|uniref:Related to methyltransferase n=1 Tax=Cephalotrichum gorgonifer TaxID=2041049 RepID=A0AAE8N968_9PEZI|nr:related to methyltransferase [Cephalotrichum gorgonifer]